VARIDLVRYAGRMTQSRRSPLGVICIVGILVLAAIVLIPRLTPRRFPMRVSSPLIKVQFFLDGDVAASFAAVYTETSRFWPVASTSDDVYHDPRVAVLTVYPTHLGGSGHCNIIVNGIHIRESADSGPATCVWVSKDTMTSSAT
jgi:hypothetical protein